ncbi:MAG: electron transporter RnfB [Desulfobacteraceae bacterium]|nr:MAG: electron transporter RnfB [Desulfobacteraceae bacterium]
MSALIVMGTLGVIIGIGLALASKIFYVYVDPLVLAVEAALPGANCGGCGMPGCSSNAEAIVAGKAAPNSCVAGSAELAETIAALLGVSIEAKEPDIALPGCTYGPDKADLKYRYDGIHDCRAVSLLSGGMKVCHVGCLGLGTCARACPFGAIHMGPEGLPVVDEKKCTGCGTCERVCPKHIITLSSITRRIIREYTTDDCTTPCQRQCPAGINIREYIHQIAIGDYNRAVQVIKERNPFPTVIGRICPRPCETDCRRKHIDEAVSINALKRFVADYERENKNRVLPFKAPSTDRKLAVIGGGMEGLSTAFFSARLGHEPTVFEATSQLGGLLRTAIARNRLPLEILDWDIEGVLEMGVKVQTGKALGKDFTISTLLADGFEAVFLASGGWDNRLARGTGSDIESSIPGTYLLIDLLKNNAASETEIPIQDNVVIAGGGKSAYDAAKICKDRGAKEVTILQRGVFPDDPEDLDTLQKLGVRVIGNSGICSLKGTDDRLESLAYADLSDLTRTAIPVNVLFLASGRFPELIFVKIKPEESKEPEMNGPVAWEGISPYKQPAYKEEIGLLSEGDPITDMSAAIKAIASGRRGAVSLHKVMYELDLELSANVLTPNFPVQDVDHLDHVIATPRQIMRIEKINNAEEQEIEKGLDENMAKAEADRCLQCGLICYKQTESTIAPAHLFTTADIPESSFSGTEWKAAKISSSDVNRIH